MAYRRRGAAINASALIAAASGSSRSYDELAPPAPAQPRRSESASLRAVALDAQRSVQRARKVGDQLLIEEEGCFFPCEVLQVVEGSRGGWLVHYLGWDHIRDEIVGGPKSAAKVLPDTPEHSLLCADLKAQIRRIQRKGSQLPRVRKPATRCSVRACVCCCVCCCRRTAAAALPRAAQHCCGLPNTARYAGALTRGHGWWLVGPCDRATRN